MNKCLQEYWLNEKAKYWPVPDELMAQYDDGSHSAQRRTHKYWQNQNNRVHRDGDKPAIIWADDTLYWYQNGLQHRDGDKPAFIGRDGKLAWWQNGQLHRFGGPALINPDGKQEWYWRGEKIPVTSQEEFIEYLTKHNLIKDEVINSKNAKKHTQESVYSIFQEVDKGLYTNVQFSDANVVMVTKEHYAALQDSWYKLLEIKNIL